MCPMCDPMCPMWFNRVLRLTYINCLERHRAETVYFAVDVVVARGESYIFHLSPRLNGFGSTFHGEILDQDNSITILQHVTVSIFYDQSVPGIIFRFGLLFRVPFVATLRAHHGGAGGVAVGRVAFGARS